jgi:hypothetical protein
VTESVLTKKLRRDSVKLLGMCYIRCMCVCVGALDLTTASDDPSSSALCVVCVGSFLGGSQGGGKYGPPGYAQHSGQHPKIFVLAVFAIFSGFFYF